MYRLLLLTLTWLSCSGIGFAQGESVPIPGDLALPKRLEEPFSKRGVEGSAAEEASAVLKPWLHAVELHMEALARGESGDELEFLQGVESSDLRDISVQVAEPWTENVLGAKANWWEADSDRYEYKGLGEALVELTAPFSELEVHFKTVAVRLDEQDSRGRAEFELRYEARGRSTEGPLQQIGHWTVEFETTEPARARRVFASSFEEVSVEDKPFFEDVTQSAFANSTIFTEQLARPLDYWTARIDQSLGMSLLGHEGFAIGDVNGDGLEDLYVLQPGGLPNRLFMHQSDHTLADAPRSAGVDFLDLSHSALIVDLDGDGDRDIAAVVSEELLLLSNEGGWNTEEGGRFVLKRVLPGVSFFSLSAADFDQDGDLDLYACAYSLPYWEDSVPIPYHDANNGRANSLYRNDGEWKFAEATREVGLDQNNSRYSFAAAWEDYDRDGDVDLYVANDFGRNNLYRNDEGKFSDVAAEAGVEDISAGMGVDWADVDGDGWMDLLVSNMYSSAGGRIAYQRQFQEGASEETRAQYQRHARGNSLFRNRGDGTFADISKSAGVQMGRWAWGAVFGDWNGDGHSDIFVPNGFVTNEDKDDL